MTWQILTGDCRALLPALPADHFHCCVTSPPYWGLRRYTDGDSREIGGEPTPAEYVASIVEVFRGVRRALREDGLAWLNLGDSYAASGRGGGANGSKQQTNVGALLDGAKKAPAGYKPGDIVGIPWLCAFALQADGWYLRGEAIWCLSGGAWVYARTQKGDVPIMVKDLVRLRPETVKLWNGEKWTQALGWSASRAAERIEIVLRSGERIGCTGDHKWPTQRGNVAARDLRSKDTIDTCQLPEPDGAQRPEYLTNDLLWLAGLYLAEGCDAENGKPRMSLHADELRWIARIERAVHHLGGSLTHVVDGNNLLVRMYGAVLSAAILSLIGGRTAHDKHLRAETWRLPNDDLRLVVEGYLDGDGHADAANDRFRLGFTRNYALERDLRALAARLGATITLNPRIATNTSTGKRYPTFHGEWRWERSGHHNEKDRGEVMVVRRSRARKCWDIGVADEPHLFALASGVLTHNSKPAPMPESINGTRWERCRRKIDALAPSEKRGGEQNGLYPAERRRGDAPHSRKQGESSTFAKSALWADCPGCAKCALNDGLVLRRGSWRPTRAHEYIFQLAKSPAYFADAQAVAEAAVCADQSVALGARSFAKRQQAGAAVAASGNGEADFYLVGASRNPRSVWTIGPAPLSTDDLGVGVDHYAAYPPELPERCIRASTSDRGCCSKCGAQVARIVAANRNAPAPSSGMREPDRCGEQQSQLGGRNEVSTVGWRPICSCGAPSVPCRVLDPFSGAGTTGMVALRMQREFVGIELNPAYVNLGEVRIGEDAPLFNRPRGAAAK